MDEKSYFHELGVKLEALGKVLQDQRSTIADVATAAHEAGIDFQFRLMPKGDAVQEGE